MDWVRDMLFGNWRNKGIALFFAVTIWFVAYQSEKQEYSTVARVEIRPADPAATIITRMRRAEVPGGADAEFDGRVRLVVSGPRKQIDKLREESPLGPFSIEVAPDRTVHAFTGRDFGFPRDGVEVTQVSPESVQLTVEPAVTVHVKNLGEKLSVTNFKENYEITVREVTPSAVEVTGPESFLDSIGVRLGVNMGHLHERFDGKVDVQLTHPEEVPAQLVERTVKVRPPQVQVTVVLKASTETLAVDAARITFRIPPAAVPVKIVLDDVVGDTIPVEFHGRKDEIARLKERLRSDPGFSLGVRVPMFDRELGGQFTFTEDALELHGFPGVQIRQHESRVKDRKTAWSYTVVPVQEAAR